MEMEVVQVVVVAAVGDELQVIAQVVRHSSSTSTVRSCGPNVRGGFVRFDSSEEK